MNQINNSQMIIIIYYQKFTFNYLHKVNRHTIKKKLYTTNRSKNNFIILIISLIFFLRKIY